MKRETFGTGLKLFTAQCLLNEMQVGAPENVKEQVLRHWENATSVESFKRAVLRDDRLAMTQGYAELSKESDGHRKRVWKMFGQNFTQVFSDIGSIRIFTPGGKSAMAISHGGGDGCARFGIFEDGEINADMMRLSDVTLDGDFIISAYDCENEPLARLSGKYFVYVYDGLVAFVKFRSYE